jgi:hypothetical protein
MFPGSMMGRYRAFVIKKFSSWAIRADERWPSSKQTRDPGRPVLVTIEVGDGLETLQRGEKTRD